MREVAGEKWKESAKGGKRVLNLELFLFYACVLVSGRPYGDMNGAGGAVSGLYE